MAGSSWPWAMTTPAASRCSAWRPPRVVKAFNTVGFELMVQPALDGGPPTMFVAGDDPAARAVAATLAAGLVGRARLR
ncbi:MAG: hypothetical protein R2755_28855 [Acidimicrobiales bacterium]